MRKYKTYLGDSVYADWDGCHIVLTTENGFGPTNEIYLEPEVYVVLTKWVTRLQTEANAEPTEGSI